MLLPQFFHKNRMTSHAHPVAREFELLVRRMHPVVVEAEAHEDCVKPEHALEHARDRDRSAALDQFGLLAGRAFDGASGGREVRRRGRHRRRETLAVIDELPTATRRGLRATPREEALGNLLGILIGNEAEADLGFGDGGDDGLRALAGVAAVDAVDVAGGSAPLAFERGEAVLAAIGFGRQADFLERAGDVEVEVLPRDAFALGERDEISVGRGAVVGDLTTAQWILKIDKSINDFKIQNSLGELDMELIKFKHPELRLKIHAKPSNLDPEKLKEKMEKKKQMEFKKK